MNLRQSESDVFVVVLSNLLYFFLAVFGAIKIFRIHKCKRQRRRRWQEISLHCLHLTDCARTVFIGHIARGIYRFFSFDHLFPALARSHVTRFTALPINFIYFMES